MARQKQRNLEMFDCTSSGKLLNLGVSASGTGTVALYQAFGILGPQRISALYEHPLWVLNCFFGSCKWLRLALFTCRTGAPHHYFRRHR